jgi:hypothetical protein
MKTSNSFWCGYKAALKFVAFVVAMAVCIFGLIKSIEKERADFAAMDFTSVACPINIDSLRAAMELGGYTLDVGCVQDKYWVVVVRDRIWSTETQRNEWVNYPIAFCNWDGSDLMTKDLIGGNFSQLVKHAEWGINQILYRNGQYVDWQKTIRP